MTEKDYYKILGVSKNATIDDIKKVYKDLARKYHPDIAGPNGDPEKFKEISNAYSVLSDPEKRKQFDTFGTDGPTGQGYQWSGGQGHGFSGSGFAGFDFSDIFSQFMDEEEGEDEGFFSRFTGGSRQRRKRRMDNLDLVYTLDVDFKTSLKGGKEKIDVYKDGSCEACSGTGSKSKHKKICETCKGKGRVVSSRRTPFGVFAVESVCPKCHGDGEEITDPCSSCSGKGYTKIKKTISIDIPAGINNNDVIRLRELGNEHSSERGDIYLKITVASHPFFKRNGTDIYCEMPIAFSDLVLGTTLKLKLFDNTIKVKIPSNTPTNTTFKVKGEGFPDVNKRGNTGSLYVRVIADVPDKLSSDYKDIIKQLSKVESETVKKDLKNRYRDYLSD